MRDSVNTMSVVSVTVDGEQLMQGAPVTDPGLLLQRGAPAKVLKRQQDVYR